MLRRAFSARLRYLRLLHCTGDCHRHYPLLLKVREWKEACNRESSPSFQCAARSGTVVEMCDFRKYVATDVERSKNHNVGLVAYM